MDLDLADALEGWLLELRQRRRTPRTLEWYQEVVRPFLAWLAERDIVRVDQLRAEQLRQYSLTRLGHLSPETQTTRSGR